MLSGILIMAITLCSFFRSKAISPTTKDVPYPQELKLISFDNKYFSVKSNFRETFSAR